MSKDKPKNSTDEFKQTIRMQRSKEKRMGEEKIVLRLYKSISDIINFRQISPDRIKLVPRPASEFYSEYFADRAEVLKNELEGTE